MSVWKNHSAMDQDKGPGREAGWGKERGPKGMMSLISITSGWMYQTDTSFQAENDPSVGGHFVPCSGCGSF